MGFWDEAEGAHDQVYGRRGEGPPEHEAKFSHELIAGAAAFEGFKLYEDKQRKDGKEVSHAFAKELVAGFAGAEVDKLAETKGMDEYDKIEAKRKAEHRSQKMYEEHYEEGQGGENYNPQRHGPPKHLKKKFPDRDW